MSIPLASDTFGAAVPDSSRDFSAPVGKGSQGPAGQACGKRSEVVISGGTVDTPPLSASTCVSRWVEDHFSGPARTLELRLPHSAALCMGHTATTGARAALTGSPMLAPDWLSIFSVVPGTRSPLRQQRYASHGSNGAAGPRDLVPSASDLNPTGPPLSPRLRAVTTLRFSQMLQSLRQHPEASGVNPLSPRSRPCALKRGPTSAVDELATSLPVSSPPSDTDDVLGSAGVPEPSSDLPLAHRDVVTHAADRGQAGIAGSRGSSGGDQEKRSPSPASERHAASSATRSITPVSVHGSGSLGIAEGQAHRTSQPASSMLRDSPGLSEVPGGPRTAHPFLLAGITDWSRLLHRRFEHRQGLGAPPVVVRLKRTSHKKNLLVLTLATGAHAHGPVSGRDGGEPGLSGPTEPLGGRTNDVLYALRVRRRRVRLGPVLKDLTHRSAASLTGTLVSTTSDFTSFDLFNPRKDPIAKITLGAFGPRRGPATQQLPSASDSADTDFLLDELDRHQHQHLKLRPITARRRFRGFRHRGGAHRRLFLESDSSDRLQDLAEFQGLPCAGRADLFTPATLAPHLVHPLSDPPSRGQMPHTSDSPSTFPTDALLHTLTSPPDTHLNAVAIQIIAPEFAWCLPDAHEPALHLPTASSGTSPVLGAEFNLNSNPILSIQLNIPQAQIYPILSVSKAAKPSSHTSHKATKRAPSAHQGETSYYASFDYPLTPLMVLAIMAAALIPWHS